MIAFRRKNGYDVLLLNVLLFLLTIFFNPSAVCAKDIASKDIDSLEHRIGQTRERLLAVEKRIRDNEKMINSIQDEEKKILGKIQICDQFIEKYKYKRNTLDDKISMNKIEQARSGREIAKRQGALAGQKDLLALRLRTLYKAGPWQFWRVISGSLAEISQKVTYMKLIAEEDARLIRKFSSRIEELQVKKEALCACQREAGEIQRQVLEQEREWSKKKIEKKKYLNTLRKEEKERRLINQGLSRSLSEIQTLLTGLQKSQLKSHASGFSARKGELPWPVEGNFLSTAPFGRQPAGEWGVSTWYNGISIQTPAGEGIYSIYSGRVVYADWCIRYGKLLIVDHGGGYCSIYAHASELLVGPGDFVREKQLIARVGDTGTVSEPELYFEIRRQETPVDPLKWLKQTF